MAKINEVPVILTDALAGPVTDAANAFSVVVTAAVNALLVAFSITAVAAALMLNFAAIFTNRITSAAIAAVTFVAAVAGICTVTADAVSGTVIGVITFRLGITRLFQTCPLKLWLHLIGHDFGETDHTLHIPAGKSA